jgi:hypothetical protein
VAGRRGVHRPPGVSSRVAGWHPRDWWRPFDPAGHRLAEIGFGGAQTARGSLVAFVHDGQHPSNPLTSVVIDEASASPRRVRAFVVDLDGTPAVTLGAGAVFESGSGPMTTEPGGDGTRGGRPGLLGDRVDAGRQRGLAARVPA